MLDTKAADACCLFYLLNDSLHSSVEMLDIQHVNDTAVIEQQHRMTAINSAIEIDVTGQIVSGKRTDRFLNELASICMHLVKLYKQIPSVITSSQASEVR